MESNIDLPVMDGNNTTGGYQPTEEQPNNQMNVGRNVLEELKAERNALDPSFLHCIQLLDKEIEKLLSGRNDQNNKQTEKVYVPMLEQRKHNLVGRLLGPKGLTLKRIQAETQTKMSILGRSSMKDRQKEEELRNSDDPSHQHLKDDLHVLIEANPPSSTQKLAAGVAEVHKMLIPPQQGQPDYASKYDQPGQLLPHPSAMMRAPPHMMSGMGGGGRMRGGRGGKPGGPRGRRGGGGRGSGRGGGGRGMQGGPSVSHRTEQMGRFGGPMGGNQPSMDSWRDSAISKDYNHGAGNEYGMSDSYNTSESYYSNFSDQGTSDLGYGGGNSRAGDWKSSRVSARRDNRHHPYSTSGMGGGPSEEEFYYN